MRRNYILSLIAAGSLIVGGNLIQNKSIIYSGIISFIIIIVYIKTNLKEVENKELNKFKNELVTDILDAITWEWNIENKTIAFSNEYLENIKKDKIYSEAEVLYFVKEEYKEEMKSFFSDIRENMKPGKYELDLFLTSKDKEIPVKILFKVFNKKMKNIGGVIIDLTKKIEQEKKIKESEKIYRLAIQGSRDILFYWNIGINIISLKGKISNIIESCEEESLKVEFSEFINNIHINDRKKILSIYSKCLNEETEFFDIEFRFKIRKDEDVWFSLKGRSFREDEEKYIYGSLSNINDRKEKEKKINFISYYDEITELPNRRKFKEVVEKIIEEVKIKYRNLAIVFIDLDNFKYINDTYGHKVGDMLLKKISDEIKKIASNDCFVARFGGDEFVIVVDHLESFDHLEVVLNKIIKTCNRNFSIDDKEIYCTVSIGVSMYGKDGDDLENLMKSADLAMYTAKENGKNKYEFFNDEILKKINRELEIKEGLRNALLDKELYGVLQPKYSSKDEKVIGFEYLIRWESDRLGFVPPIEFIRIAENTGQIIEIGKYIIKDAIKMCKKLTEIIEEEFKIAINLSEVQLRDPGIVDFIKKTIEENEVNPKNIEVEITESIIMESAEKNIGILKQLKDVGVTIALDDFGTGYSSLNYLRVLPIDILKIDKSFIDYINKDEKSEYIIETIIELSHCFKFLVVAEGVETKKQFEFLKQNSCDIIQGYYFSKPLPFNEIVNKIGAMKLKEEVKMTF